MEKIEAKYSWPACDILQVAATQDWRKWKSFKRIASFLPGFEKTARPTLVRKTTILEYS
jgi:hypothetical protein